MNPELPEKLKIEPPYWWIGFNHNKLNLLVYGKDIGLFEPYIKHPKVKLHRFSKVENTNYLFLHLTIDKDTLPGIFKIVFERSGHRFSIDYEFKQRESSENKHKGFDASDVVYLLMPDRFAQGNQNKPANTQMIETNDRQNPDGRHGGDLKGILKNLDYFTNLGITALWLNPVFESNMPTHSYHGYAITDFYKVDPRLGTNFEYKELVNACHNHGLKVIMDMVFNHCGSNHWFIKDLPSKDWIHQFDEFTRSNYRGEVATDPYASEQDKLHLEKAWFDPEMPDFNHNNPLLSEYLIQNSIWWAEYAGIDGIRMDTYPYVKKEMLAGWIDRIMAEYPGFNIVGESWLQKESHTAFWQKDFPLDKGLNTKLPSVTDFPLQYAVIRALNQADSWTGGLSELYYVLSQDFLYPEASMNLIFPDNHDVQRIYSSLNHNFNKFKMAMSFYLTTRGIPQIYYGTEILMDGDGSQGHGFLRQDFPGGWKTDKTNAFNKNGLTSEKQQALEFLTKLLNWRKNKQSIHKGKLVHFIPDNGIYVYFRILEEECVMVILSKKDSHHFSTSRYSEILIKFSRAKDVITEEIFDNPDMIPMEGYSARILELS